MYASFKRLLSFSGRASRSEYWLYVGPMLALLAGALAYDLIVLGPTEHHEFSVTTSLITGDKSYTYSTVTRYGPRLASLIVSLLVLLPFASVLTRRVHDIGYPSWYAWLAIFLAFFFGPSLSVVLDLLTSLSESLAIILAFLVGLPQLVISVLAFVVVVLWGTTPSEPGANEYGPDPMEAPA